MGYNKSSQFLLVNAFSHVGSQVFDFLIPAFNGANIVMGKNPGYTGQLELIEKYKISHINPSPANLNFWAKYEDIHKHDLSSLNYILIGSACPNFDLIDIFVQKAGLKSSVKLRNTYGATETASCTFCQNEFTDSDIRSIGLAAPGVSFKVIDPEDEFKVITEPEIEGELVIKLHNELPLYFKDPTKTATALTSDGFYKTGDLVKLDGRFQIYLSGRISEFIKYCGFTISPALLEQIVMESDLVVDCAVVGKPDELKVEIPTACVVLSEKGKHLGKAEIEQQLLDLVASQVQESRTLREVEIVEEVPRNTNEKIIAKFQSSKEYQVETQDYVQVLPGPLYVFLRSERLNVE
ncbi:uncharacterized protein LOC142342986 [Convolutriloba macropyga]|uniref:uncharacterized protein LOC142342986 n=1 Tax=Convolutriloba macropyga TaxID=536237 RepID=UPI003F5286B6